MDSRSPSISTRFGRGLLAAVVVLAGMMPGIPCCCGSMPRCESPDEKGLSAVDPAQECCCCKQTDNINDPTSVCCCSAASQNPGAACQSSCRCAERPATKAVMAQDRRNRQEQDRSSWITVPGSIVCVSETLTTHRLRAEQQFRGDPCSHNLTQAILCVWRN